MTRRTTGSRLRARGGRGSVALPAVVCAVVALAGCAGGTSSAAPASTAGSPVTDSAAGSTADSSSGSTAVASAQPATGSADPSAAGAQSASADATAAGATAAAVTNPLFSLKPGRQSVRLGFKIVGHRKLDHRRVYTITDVHKVVDGVTVTIAIDQDIDGGELSQQSLELLALGDDATIRYLGSYTETYEGGQFVNFTDAWLSGVKGAKGGALVPGHPQVGLQFLEAQIPGEGTRNSVVTKIGGEHKCVPFRCFDNLVAINESGIELKYYSPGVGGVLTVPLEGDAQETEELVNVATLSPAGLAEISNEVVKLDQHARTVAPDVYGASDPAKRATS